MKITNERYTDSCENFNEVHSFLRKMVRMTGKLQTWEFVRLEFWRWCESNKSGDPFFKENNAHIWRSETGEMAGLFISESGGSFFSLIVHPQHPNLAAEMVDWAQNVWGKGKGSLNTDCYEHSLETTALTGAGFVNRRPIGNTRKYDLQNTEYAPAPLEEGFTIVEISEAPDYEGKSRSIQQAFLSDDLTPGKVDYWRKDLPSYSPHLDLSVVNQAGEHIAFCYGFTDEQSGVAVIETVGTRPEYQQRGFGKAVITECFIRLKAQGIHTAYITGFSEAANALYQSLRPVEIWPMYSYTSA